MLIVLLTVAGLLTLPSLAAAAAPQASGAAASRVASARAEATRALRLARTLRAALPAKCRTGGTPACRTHRAKLARANAKSHRARSAYRRLLRHTASKSKKQPAKSAKPATKSGGPTASPAPTPARGTAGPSPAGPAAAGPQLTTAPASVGPGASVAGIAFQPGIVSGTWLEYDVPAARSLGAREVRLEFPIDTPVADMAKHFRAYADAGIRILPLAGFPGTIPTSAQARNLASWARAFGPGGTFWADRTDGQLAMTSIEFGNETSMTWQYGDDQFSASYSARAQSYALRFRDARAAIDAAGAHVDLLAVADDWTGRWVKGLYDAVPGFDRYVGAWVVHPYGPDFASRLNDTVRQTRAQGAPDTVPIDITEWGLATDGGHCLSDNYGQDPCMDDAKAAGVLASSVAQMRSLLQGRLRRFILYQVRDNGYSGATNDRESFFGALHRDLSEKGAFSAAVRGLLAGS